MIRGYIDFPTVPTNFYPHKKKNIIKSHHALNTQHHLESWVASSSFQKNPSQKREKFQRQNRSGLAESKKSYTSQVEALNSAAAELMNSWDLWNLETNETTWGGWEGSWVGFRKKRKERCFLVVIEGKEQETRQKQKTIVDVGKYLINYIFTGFW